MGVHSGRRGVVNSKSTVRNWSINDAHNAAVGVASNTAYGHMRRRGVQSWAGSYEQYGITPPVMPGESFTFLGYMAPDDDVSGVGERYSGTALISQIALSMNWAAGELISISSDFAGHLALTPASAGAEVADSTDPTAYPVAGTYLEYSTDGSTWTTWTDLATASLTIQNALQAYVNSSTYTGGKLWTGQKAGPIDWSLSVAEQNVDRSRFAKGDQLYFRLHMDTSGTNYWELKTGLVKDFTGIQVDRETGKIIQQTVNVEMNSNDVSNGDLGHILLPGGTVWWGL